MLSLPYQFKQITTNSAQDLQEILQVHAKKEGWFYSSHDIQMFLDLEFVKVFGLYDQQNKVIASIILTHYSAENKPSVYTIGAFIVIEELRNKGIGTILWRKTLETIQEENKLLALSSVPKAMNFYQCHGFFSSEIRTISMSKQYHCETGKNIHSSLSKKDMNKILNFDREIFQFTSRERASFLEYLLTHADFVGQCYIDEKFNTLTGYSIVTHNQDDLSSYRLSPMYANSEETAELLITQLTSFFVDKSCSLSLNILTNSIFIQLLEKHGFEKISESETTLMTTKNSLLDPEKFRSTPFVALSSYEAPHEAIWSRYEP